jgi:threonine-phosphate decarboxylase
MDFVENAKELSALNLINTYDNCIVLRGFSKFFAAPGLRLGYGITSDLNCHRSLEKQRHHWSINSLAAFGGKELMVDTDFINASKTFITKERQRISEILAEQNSLKVFPANANFFFIQLLDRKKSASAAFDYLIRQGFMIRDTSSFPFLHGEYIRFCILNKQDNDRMLNALLKYLND